MVHKSMLNQESLCKVMIFDTSVNVAVKSPRGNNWPLYCLLNEGDHESVTQAVIRNSFLPKGQVPGQDRVFFASATVPAILFWLQNRGAVSQFPSFSQVRFVFPFFRVCSPVLPTSCAQD